MRTSISHSVLQILLHEADVAARRLRCKLHLAYQDLADVRQDLLVDLIARLPAFDPDRGSLGAFAGIVMANRATRIAAKTKRERLLYGALPISLDEVLGESDCTTRGDLIADDQGLSSCFSQPIDPFTQAELCIDIDHSIGSLEPEDRALCAALRQTTVHRLAAQKYGARSSLFRRVKEIRSAWTALGMDAA